MRMVRTSTWRPLLVANGLLCVVACGDGSSGRAAPMASATPVVDPSPLAGPSEDRVFALGARRVGGESVAVVVRSDNGGQTFARVLETRTFEPLVLDLAFVDASHGWAIGTQFRELPLILHTRDGGASWVGQTKNLVLENEVQSLGDIAFASAERGVIVGLERTLPLLSARPVILSTTDGGETWQSVVTPRRPASLRSVCLTTSGTGLAVGTSAVSGPLVVRTDDGGVTWRDITADLALFPGADVHTVSCTETGQFWIGGEALRHPQPGLSIPRATMLFSPDRGRTWEDRTPPSLTNFRDSVTNLDFTDATHGWALAERGPAVFRTDDAGFTRIEQALPADTPSSMSEESLTVFHTDDAGLTWIEQVLPTDAPSGVNTVEFRDRRRGVVVGSVLETDTEPSRALAFFTVNGGSTWERGAIVPEDIRWLGDVAFPPE